MIELRGAATFGSGTSPSKAAMARWVRTPGLACRVPGALESDEQAKGGHPGLQIEQRARSDRRGVVIIDAAASGNPEALATDLCVLDAENVTVFGRMVSGRLRITAIPAFQDRSSLQFAGPAMRPRTSRT